MTPPMRTLAVRQPNNVLGIFSRIGQYIAPMILMAIDYFAVTCAALTAWYLRAVIMPHHFVLPGFHINNTYIYLILPFTYFLFLAYDGMYTKRLPFWKSVEMLFKICSYVSALAIVVMYFTGKAENISRAFIGMTWLLSFLYLISTRYITKRFLSAIGLWQKPIVIVGAGKTAELLAKRFEGDPNLGYKIVGLVEDHYSERPLMHRYLHIGRFSDVEKAIINSRVQDVIIATPGLEREEMLDLVYRIQPYVRDLTIVPDLFGVPLSNMEVETLFHEKTVMLRMRNNMTIWRNRVLKNTFDFISSVCGTILISPILFGIAVVIYISSPGPVIFAHTRIGRNGKYFPCYKFLFHGN
jgi:FlaA1/EpsC-like NDP-sugar epimerase